MTRRGNCGSPSLFEQRKEDISLIRSSFSKTARDTTPFPFGIMIDGNSRNEMTQQSPQQQKQKEVRPLRKKRPPKMSKMRPQSAGPLGRSNDLTKSPLLRRVKFNELNASYVPQRKDSFCQHNDPEKKIPMTVEI
jgi:hypothetical protein